MSAAVMAMAASTISSSSGDMSPSWDSRVLTSWSSLHADQVGGQPRLALAQRLLDPLAFGDVPRDPDDPVRPPRRVGDPADVGVDPAPGAVLAVVLIFPGPLRARGAGADLLGDPRPLRLREAVGVGPSHHLRRGPPEEPGGPFIPERDGPLQVGGDDRVADVGQHQRVPVQRLLGPDPLGDVLDRAEHPHCPAGLVVDRLPPRLGDDDRCVLADHAQAPLVGLVVPDRLPQRFQDGLAVIRVDVAHAPVGRHPDFLGPQPEDAVMLVRPDDLVAREVPAPTADVGDLLGLGQLRLAPPQGLLGPLPLGDVLEQRHEVIDRPVPAPHALHRDGGVDDPTVLADPPLVHRVAVDLPGHDPVELGDVGGQVVRVGHLGPRLPQEFVARVAEDPTDLVVDLQTTLGRRGDRHADQPEVEVPPEPLLALA